MTSKIYVLLQLDERIIIYYIVRLVRSNKLKKMSKNRPFHYTKAQETEILYDFNQIINQIMYGIVKILSQSNFQWQYLQYL